jgi:dextranase
MFSRRCLLFLPAVGFASALCSFGLVQVVEGATPLGWIGYTYNYPTAGSVDPTSDLWINTETAPHGAAVSALVSYSTNGGSAWNSATLSSNGVDGSNGNDQWHVDLGEFHEGTVVQYVVKASDSLGNSMWDSNYWQGFYVRVNTLIRDVYTDKARYNPGDNVQIFVNLANSNNATASGQLRVTISRLFNSVTNFTSSVSLSSGSITTSTFSWSAPTNNYSSYGVDVDFLTNGIARDSRSSAIDVSSNWTKFPRYGFFTDFGPGESVGASSNTAFTLSKYHINAVMFYDWMWSHNRLIPYDNNGNIVNNFTTWNGISQSMTTITNRIKATKGDNMSPVAYDLMYGDSSIAASNLMYGVSGVTNVGPEHITWAAFNDPGHTNLANIRNQSQQIWVMDVSNPNWQSWIFGQYTNAMTKLGFEGIHLDNLGGATSYPYNSSNSIDESVQFPNFINACKPQLQTANTNATVTENDVAGNYLSTVAPSAEDVYYSEVWGYNNYNDVRTLIQTAQSAGNGKPVVLGAYMNYQSLPQPTDTLNEASVRLMDACVFGNGAFHIELGEGIPVQMLTNPYWPTHNPPMPPTLPQVLRNYYDFAVRYENFLFFNSLGGVTDGTSSALTWSGTHTLSKDGQSNSIWTIVKLWNKPYDAVSLINLYGVDTIWRNLSPTPAVQTNISFKYYVNSKVYSLYVATPDDGLGRPQSLPFTDGTDGLGYYVQLTVPQLQYWDVLVLDKGPTSPQNLTAIGGPGQINLTWSAVNGATGYIVKRGGNQIATTSSTNYTDIGLALGQNYCYTVAATNNVAVSLDSSPACATTLIATTATNLLAYWTFDEGSGTVAYDSSGNSNTGTVVNLGSNPITWDSGVIRGALYCDGQTEVTVPNSASLNPVNGVSIAGWVDADYWGSGSYVPRIVEKGASDNQYALLSTSSGQLEFLLSGVSNGTLVVNAPANSSWHHLAGTYDGTVMRFYVDGQQVAQQPASGPPSVTTDALAVGIKPGGNPLTAFSGSIDDLRIYGRALSPAEVTQLFAMSATNLLAYWTFDEGSGSIAYDSSGYNNTGTVVNLGGNPIEWTSGVIDGALYFDGQKEMTVSNSAYLNPVMAISIAGWVNADYWGSGSYVPRIVEKGVSDNQYALLSISSGQLEFLLAGVSNGTLVANAPSNSSWHHLAGTYDGAVMRFYVDGQQVAQQAASGPPMTSSDPLAVGIKPGGNALTAFSGSVDDLRICGRALSFSEISQLYNTDTVGDGIPNWWRQQYFGTSSSTDATSCARCDGDGTGQHNLFKYVAGLNPTDPTAVFLFWITRANGQSNQVNLIYNPVVTGRTYTVQSSTDLVSSVYQDLTSISGPSTNGNQATVTDLNAATPSKFYRLHISLP